MEKRRQSIVQNVSWILVWTLILNFTGGCITFYQLGKANIRYIYNLEEQLIESSVQKIEMQIEDIQNTLYDMMVSKEIQEAGSALIESSSASRNLSSLNTITGRIWNGMQGKNSILCANFLNQDGEIRVIASANYYKLTEECAEYLEKKAVEAEGDPVILDGERLLGNDEILVLARQVREKKNLSFRHIGVIALFVDVGMLCEELAEIPDSVILLQGPDERLKYVLNDKKDYFENYNISPNENQNYWFEKIENQTYFAVQFQKNHELFSYTVLTPYSAIFKDISNAFKVYAILFFLFGLAVVVLALYFTHRVIRDIRLFIQHINQIPGEHFTSLPIHETQDVKNQEMYVLMNAFNEMSRRMNDLVRDNYQNQLLIKEAKIQALQSQINPHFLYNTLNSLYWMAKTAGNSDAADMISSLSILMREAIGGKDYIITVDKEIDIVYQYFIIQKYRYDERLQVKFDVSEECSNQVIPKFSIQPLVENAISYGLECILEACTIEIRIYREKENCICQVRNNGPAPETDLIVKLENGILKPKGTGVGLMNIHRRIQSVFGEGYGIRIFREKEQTVAQITMKYVSVEEYQEEIHNGAGI